MPCYLKTFLEVQELSGQASLLKNSILNLVNHFDEDNKDYALFFLLKRSMLERQKISQENTKPNSAFFQSRFREPTSKIDEIFIEMQKDADFLKKYTEYMRQLDQSPLSIKHVYLRSSEIDRAIIKGFEEVSQPNKEEEYNLQFRGAESYEFKVSGLSINTRDIFYSLEEKSDKSTELDLGTGNDVFILNNIDKNVNCYGINASQYKYISDLTNEQISYLKSHYIQGNIESLYDINDISNINFDCIFSRNTFRYLTDPAGAIIQAYEKLKLNGKLLVDTFDLPGAEGFLHSIIEDLKKQGYRVVSQCKGNITSFVIQKTEGHEHLQLPIKYSKVSKGIWDNLVATYQPLDLLKKDDFSKDYQNGIEVVKNKINRLNLHSILTQLNVNKLEELMQNEAFVKCDPELKYLLILDVVGKIINCQDISQFENETISSMVGRHNITKIMGIYQYIKYVENNVVCSLFEQNQFKDLDLEEQIALLKIAALFDLTRIGRNDLDKKTLSAMEIPYKEFTPDYGMIQYDILKLSDHVKPAIIFK
ncbi:methyltransferase domain-containing protein [Legionella waltersii]|uniref:Methyltransferase domain-containing protein n=1 Tax=Legionella waltersii TaxID=66969 RepID=A0A0W1AP73_9GAMM|nr:methyltransferase domain-containing protein [Legionella waltersii]KTD83135.1 hypothetical protein Lwal_0043 [Legionella waltersii]SNU96850.1 Uncharacterised protein [Legionella waltersii]